MSEVIDEAPTTPALAALPPDIQKAVNAAFEDLREKAWSNEEKLAKERARASDNQPKAFFADPNALMDSVGMGYRSAPSHLTYDTLRQISERDTYIAAILLTRIDQVASFTRPQPNKYSVGFRIQPRHNSDKKQMTDSERDRCKEIQMLLLNTGREYNLGRDGFLQFVQKFVRDSLTYDQACAETVRTRGGSVHSFAAVPSDTIRTATPRQMKGTPPRVADLRKEIRYVQVINAAITAEFTIDEMAFAVRNPRSWIKANGYGAPEIETLMTTVTSHLHAEQWNQKAFSQGSTMKGILNIKGNIPPVQFEAFKRQWHSQVSGIANAWKTPMLNSEDVQWLPTGMSNTEMGYQMWMEYLIKITTAIFRIDPAEINFDLRGGVGQQPVFMSSNEAQQKASKDRGLQPLMRFVEDTINRHIVFKIDPRFEMAFVGLDAKTEEQAQQLRMQQVQNTHTLNEVRAMDDLPPVQYGDNVMNATYIGYKMQKEQAAMMAQQQPQQATPAAGGQPAPPPRFAQAPGDEEEHGADQLRQFAEPTASAKPDQSGGGGNADGAADDESSGPDPKTLSRLHIDDWDSVMTHSLRTDDLKKSALFDTIDID
jgi:HK97 family phage portal protein